MKLQMARDSLFAILLRSPWWISFALAAAVAVAALTWLPKDYAVAGALGGAPFVVIGAIAAWRQLHTPGARRVAATQDAAAAMSWRDFSAALEDAFRRDGYTVTRLAGGAADFELVKSGRRSLASGKRWKAADTGIEPLRELQAELERRDAHDGIFVALGNVSANARRFATANRIRMVQGPELAALLPRLAAARAERPRA